MTERINNERYTAINRIKKMEHIFNQTLNAMKNGISAYDDHSLREMLNILKDYYENGQWLKDYECDERGELPPDLKRGVLSQDSLYDLLTEIEHLGGIRNGK